MTNSPRSIVNLSRFVSLVISLGMLLGACQAQPVPASPTQGSNAPANPGNAQSISPTSMPVATPTPQPLNLWVDPALPADFVAKLSLPEGVLETQNKSEANLFLSADDLPRNNRLLGETWQTYALAAPFFTIQDGITSAELRSLARGYQPESVAQGIASLIMREQDHAAIARLLHLSVTVNPPKSKIVLVQDDYFKPEMDTQPDTWAILPFEKLSPKWKVITVDGKSPLDDNFSPKSSPLTLRIVLSTSLAELSLNKDQLAALLPAPNRDRDQLTSLIMTGVTAMARDTAYVMSTEGVLFPGTEIRDFMRAADLTHISNEVSFYEGCPFPDPDYTGYIFCSNPSYIDLLDDVGADIIELTGNHNNDVRALYKTDSVPFTLDLYRKHGMKWYAGGVNIADAKAPLLIENHGNKLAFIGCNSYGPYMAWATEDSSGAAPCEDFGWISDEVAKLRSQGYLPIVTFQYQEDYLVKAQSSAIRDFRKVADAGAVILNGSQSHVGKAMEFWNHTFIHYGLGNLFFDQPDFYITYDGFIQKHFFYQGRHISTQLLTITLEETAKPRLMTPEERQKFLNTVFEASRLLKE